MTSETSETSDDRTMAGREETVDPKPAWLEIGATVRNRHVPRGVYEVTEYRHRSDGWYMRITRHPLSFQHNPPYEGWWEWSGNWEPVSREGA